MLDLKWLSENKELVKRVYKKKGLSLNVDELFELDQKKRQLQVKVDNLRHRQNELSDQIAKTEEHNRSELLNKAKIVKEAIEMAEKEFQAIDHPLHDLTIQLHNIVDDSVPSKSEGDRIEQVYGQPIQLDFPVKDHLELGELLDILDVERAVKVSGARFSYLKNEAVLLQFALVRWVIDKLVAKGFVPMITPMLVKEEAMFGSGFLPAEPNEIFKLAQDNLFLIGTAEVPLASYHANETLIAAELPRKYVGYSSAFRREAGSYGKDTQGIIRQHQFDKVEQFIFSQPDKSWVHFEELANNSEEIFSDLELPFRKMTINAGDLGAPNVKKYDFEVWLPSQKTYRELASCSHDTDFQARRLNIRYKDKTGSTKFVHTLNNTAIAIGRTIVAILENHQQVDGSVKIPQALIRYTGFDMIKAKEAK